jgi:protein SCO1
MTDHLGNPVGLSNLKGGWSLLFFGFTTCPDICPTTLSVLNDAVSGLEEPPAIVMVSVDPERDTPERLAQYVPAFNPDFVGYTGTFEETVKLAEQLNIAFGKVPGDLPGSYLVDHSASLVVIDPDGRYAGFIKAPHNSSNIQRIVLGLPL